MLPSLNTHSGRLAGSAAKLTPALAVLELAAAAAAGAGAAAAAQRVGRRAIGSTTARKSTGSSGCSRPSTQMSSSTRGSRKKSHTGTPAGCAEGAGIIPRARGLSTSAASSGDRSDCICCCTAQRRPARRRWDCQLSATDGTSARLQAQEGTGAHETAPSLAARKPCARGDIGHAAMASSSVVPRAVP